MPDFFDFAEIPDFADLMDLLLGAGDAIGEAGSA
jgi:hypothetical protein